MRKEMKKSKKYKKGTNKKGTNKKRNQNKKKSVDYPFVFVFSEFFFLCVFV